LQADVGETHGGHRAAHLQCAAGNPATSLDPPAK
jgi:hypothetical protein